MCGSLYRIYKRLYLVGPQLVWKIKPLPPSPPPTNFCSHNSECQCCNYDISFPLSIMRKFQSTKKVTRRSHKLFNVLYLWHVQTRLSATYLSRTHTLLRNLFLKMPSDWATLESFLTDVSVEVTINVYSISHFAVHILSHQ